MNDITLFEKDWGNLVFSFCLAKMDVLPRITLAAMSKATIANVGFLFFTLNLTVWSDDMREFNRSNRERAERNRMSHDSE